MDRVIWRGEYGVLNNSQIPKRKPTDETIFPIASVSKVLTVRKITEAAIIQLCVEFNFLHITREL